MPRGWRNGGKLQISKLQVWRDGQLEDLATCNLEPFVRLPTDAEWLRLAGGEKEGKKERYPWDVPGSGRVTELRKGRRQDSDPGAGQHHESGIGGTSPVAMYPLGESKPFGLWDVAGNVWEWTDSWYDKEQSGRVVRGGSWQLQSDERPPVRPLRVRSGPLERRRRLPPGLPH